VVLADREHVNEDFSVLRDLDDRVDPFGLDRRVVSRPR